MLRTLLELLDMVTDKYEPRETDYMSISEIENERIKRDADLSAEMEYRIENESDPLTRKKLQWRLNSGVYEWNDLYK